MYLYELLRSETVFLLKYAESHKDSHKVDMIDWCCKKKLDIVREK